MRTAAEWALAVRALPGVTRVQAVGSRATGTANELSDWDYAVETEDFPATAAGITALVERSRPLAAQWDPFPADTTFMLLLPGAVKVDFIFTAVPAQSRDAWDPSRDSPTAIELHFWDWMLWLGSKVLKGEDGLVRSELAKMFALLLQPLGTGYPPHDLTEAIAEFTAWREQADGERADAQVGREVMAALRRARVIE